MSSDRREADRRQSDRRRGDRRRPPRSADGGSEFSAWRDDDEALPSSPESTADDGAPSTQSRYLARQARRLVASDDGAALPRILRVYVLGRMVLAAALLLAPVSAAFAGGHTPPAVLGVAVLYAAQTLSLWMLRKAEPATRQAANQLTLQQWAWTIAADAVAFSLLRLIDPAGQFNYTALMVLPVLMAGVLTHRRIALATTAALVLVLLGGQWLFGGTRGDAVQSLNQAGLAGAGMFVITLLASEVAQRLAGEERSARSHLALARQQTQLNRLVIEEMAEGVLVVDRHGGIRTLNPAARKLLGVSAAAQVPLALGGVSGLAPLADALHLAYVHGAWPDDARELVLTLAEGEPRAVQVRARFTRRQAVDGLALEDICVLFIEDMRLVQARQRHDRLAAMGRMSAAIAHEIRNPLAAIAQANALLREDALPPTQQRLAGIVADNAARLGRIVDDVLTLAALPAPRHATLDLRAGVARICDDWLRGAAAAAGAAPGHAARLSLSLPDAALPAYFDDDDLRRVLVNLLDNAERHASAEPGAIVVQVVAAPAPGTALRLTVASDGAPMASDTERHLFEPFFSTRSRGSGLGLYICRQLCARHGASIDYRRAAAGERHANVFRVVLQPAPADHG